MLVHIKGSTVLIYLREMLEFSENIILIKYQTNILELLYSYYNKMVK